MTCRELVDCLLELTGAELSAAQRERVDEHLHNCPSCVAYLESYRLAVELSHRLPPKPMPPHLAKHLNGLLSAQAGEKACAHTQGSGSNGADT